MREHWFPALTHDSARRVLKPGSISPRRKRRSHRAKLEPDERVLVHGGAGAVGLYAVQLAHICGARVITTVSTQDIDFVKRLGANEVIDYKACRFEKEVRAVDVVFDAVGSDTLERSWGVLKPSGRMIAIAADSEGTSEERVKDAFFIVEPIKSS